MARDTYICGSTRQNVKQVSELTQRKESILKAVILEYILGAEPIGSELITQKYELGIRSATVRNEMAEITDLGLLDQPHTSAGRIPSDQGYRYYVDRLIVQRAPSAESQGKLQEATDEDSLRLLLQESTKALSKLTHLLSVAATTRDTNVRIRNVIFTALGPQKGLLVLVLENGQIENRVVSGPPELTLQHVGKINDILLANLSGKPIGSIKKLKTPTFDDPTMNKLVRTVYAMIRETARDLTRGHIITEGEEYVLAQPEFMRNADQLENVLKSIEDEETLYQAIMGEGITIGKENPITTLQNLSIIRRTFYVGEEEAGTLAIVGPTRLPYDRAVSLLDFTAKAVSDTLTKLMK